MPFVSDLFILPLSCCLSHLSISLFLMFLLLYFLLPTRRCMVSPMMLKIACRAIGQGNVCVCCDFIISRMWRVTGPRSTIVTILTAYSTHTQTHTYILGFIKLDGALIFFLFVPCSESSSAVDNNESAPFQYIREEQL